MGLLRRLFGKTAPPAMSSGGRISMHAVNLQQGHGLSSKRCGIDGRTFTCPAATQTILTEDPARFALDVGGYCDSCGAYRCHEHARWIEVGPMTYGVACDRCGSRMRGAT